jgi:hypothetical protein
MMSQTQLKYLVFPVVLSLLLHVNYQSGFVPEKDFWTIAGIVATMLGFDIETARRGVQNSNKESNNG